MIKQRSLPSKSKFWKFTAWNKLKSLRPFKLTKGSKAGVVVDRKNRPRFFLMDTRAMIDMLSAIDESLVDNLPTKKYHSKSANPAGWLIDELESQLPLDSDFEASLKKAVSEAESQGWIPSSKLKFD